MTEFVFLLLILLQKICHLIERLNPSYSYIDHHSSGCLNTHCKNIAVNESVAEWQHYRKTCHSPIAVEICNKVGFLNGIF